MLRGLESFKTLVVEMQEFFNEPEIKAAKTLEEFTKIVELRIVEMEKANMPAA